ncbi:MAG: L-threonylcarbamoyladenylate synthase [Saprospiraceae bacterium]
MLRISFHENNPNKRDLKKVVDLLNEGAVIIFPTDTLYAMGCLMTNRNGIEKICRILDKKEKVTKMSLICPSISVVSQYTQQIENQVFKTMKRYLPGPYTFVLNSNNLVQKFFKNSRQEIGIRIPNHVILQELLAMLDSPLISTSLNTDGEKEYIYNEPEEIENTFRHQVDVLIDTGIGLIGESTVINCTGSEMEIIREGIGPIE